MTDIHKIQPLHLAAFLMFVLPGNVYSASGMLDENALLIDIPTVTTASRFNQHLSDAPVSMTVIDRAMIQASGAQTIPDLFRLVPGFQVAHVNTNKYAVTYHGHSDDFPRRLEVMIDGRSVYFPIISAVDWTSLGLHLEDIERIEVVRGSNTATHGSNAFLGAINIITRHPSTESRFSASGTLGSLNTESGNFRFSGFNSIGHYRISASHESNNGSTLFSDGQQRNYLNYSGSFSPSEQDQIDIWLGIDKGYIHIGEHKPARGAPQSIFTPKREYSSNYQHIQWQRYLNHNNTIGIKAYQNNLKLVERAPTIDDFIKAGQNFQSSLLLLANNPNYKFYNEDGLSQQRDIEFFTNQNLVFLNSYTGLAIRKSNVDSPSLFDQGKVNSTRYRVFNNTTIYPAEYLTLNLGLSYEKEESGRTANSWRNAFTYHYDKNTAFRFGYTHSERLPSLYETSSSTTIFIDRKNNLIFDAIRRPNYNLKPEKINSFEVGLLYQLNQGHLDFRLFSDKVSNGIERYAIAFPEFQLGKFTTNTNKNLSTWVNNGAELQLKLKPYENLWFTLNYTYTNSTKDKFYDNQTNPTSVVDRRDPLAPRHSASAIINWTPQPSIDLSAAHYYVDQMHWFKGDTRDAYNRTDLRISKSWQPSAHTKAETALVIQNAFGPTYQEFYDYHDFERRIFATFRLKYD